MARWGYPRKFKKVLYLFWGAIFIDLDHLLASPIFDPDRCSIFFHPLHSSVAIGCYLLLCLFKKTRIIGFALCLHILADSLDCLI
ncbi:MAG: hypothetical protein ABR91_00370 [Polaribacter sp. BACL8 MAG-120531-bin13]|nr:MAG: hypothetical protein ABR91_00370 [Polaribacter sp. BACL8 MAG-120531-bin13]